MYPDGSCVGYGRQGKPSCNGLRDSIARRAVVGVAMGMVVVGIFADRLGHRNGGIVTSALMFGAVALLTLLCALLAPADNDDQTTLLRVVGICMFLFELGVRGEYPVSAASSSKWVMSLSRSLSSMSLSSIPSCPPDRRHRRHRPCDWERRPTIKPPFVGGLQDSQ
jgi:hypothetical protein